VELTNTYLDDRKLHEVKEKGGAVSEFACVPHKTPRAGAVESMKQWRHAEKSEHIKHTTVLTEICYERMCRKEQILIFCSSKARTQQLATRMAELMKLMPDIHSKIVDSRTSEEIATLRQRRSYLSDELNRVFASAENMPAGDSSRQSPLAAPALQGVAYHNSSLQASERRVIEDAYYAGTISVICCTTTLAQSINLPASWVIFLDMRAGIEPLNLLQYMQAAGRTGRPGYSTSGTSIVCTSNASEVRQFKTLLTTTPGQLTHFPHRNGPNCAHVHIGCHISEAPYTNIVNSISLLACELTFHRTCVQHTATTGE
jgi:replicative superfamily II helicase